MSTQLFEIFRENVREIMGLKKISQVELASYFDPPVTQSFVSQVLSGHRNPGLDTVEKFAEALGKNPLDLLKKPKKKSD